jgi:hypothetical protein
VQDAGRVLGIRKGNTLICWRSAYGNHAKDKKKELGAKARALRFRFRSGKAQADDNLRLLLVIDGDFTQQDVDYLLQSGWDEIFYPDEMDKLAKAII